MFITVFFFFFLFNNSSAFLNVACHFEELYYVQFKIPKNELGSEERSPTGVAPLASIFIKCHIACFISSNYNKFNQLLTSLTFQC